MSTPEASALYQHKRFYSLDALRAVMMLLGLVIHTGVTYMPYDSPVRTIMAKNTWIGFFYLINLIHSFRMPVFFFVAGYFGALLFFRKGPYEMLQNRIMKILLPLILGVLILYPAVYFAFVFSSARIAGEANALQKAVTVMKDGKFLPYRLSHLWFLYDLVLFSIATWIPAMIFRNSINLNLRISTLASQILQKPWLRIVMIAILYFIGLVLNKEYTLHTNVSFWLDRNLLYCYFIFYLMGWMVFKTDILITFNWKPGFQIATGLVLFAISMYIELQLEGSWKFRTLQIINAFVTTFLTFGITGWFLTHLNHFSERFSYIMGAAYYVYLVHVPIAVIMPGLMTNLNLPVIIEFLITFSVTVTFCFGTYHLFIRKKFIGKFLDGKLFQFPTAKSLSQKIRAGSSA